MSLSANIGGSWRSMNGMWINIGGAWSKANAGWVNIGGTWRQFYTATQALAASTNLLTVAGAGTINTTFAPIYAYQTITVLPTGGTGTYTYFWEWVSGQGTSGSMAIIPFDPNMQTVGNPNLQTVLFGITPLVTISQTFSATWRCRVQDGVNTVYTAPVNIFFYF